MMSSNDEDRGVPVCRAPFSYADFLRDHLLPNRPCLFETGLVASWPCFQSLLTAHPTDPSEMAAGVVVVNLDRLVSLQGSDVVSLHRPPLSPDEGDDPTICDQAQLADVVNLWKTGHGRGCYVKDWHLADKLEREGQPALYETPVVFRDDWLNGWERSRGESDFRFVYLGGPETSTLIHRDVYSSYSWSTNIFGTKVWHLFPPSHAHLLRRILHERRSELVADVRRDEDNSARFPGWEAAREASVRVVQQAGETIFVPSGWYHQVDNVSTSRQSGGELTLSINHNWINSTNVGSAFQTVVDDIASCESSIDDVRELLLQRAATMEDPDWEWEREWVQEVQELVTRDAGWGWAGFWGMVAWGLKDALETSQQEVAWRPSTSFVHTQVRLLVDRWEARRDATHLPEVRHVVGEVKGLLEKLGPEKEQE